MTIGLLEMHYTYLILLLPDNVCVDVFVYMSAEYLMN